MRTIYKYILKPLTEQDVSMPEGAEILSVAEQDEQIVLYAMVITGTCLVRPRTIYIHGTGHVIEASNLRFIGTVKLQNGVLMFHVFVKELSL